jgi:hypothetical protein
MAYEKVASESGPRGQRRGCSDSKFPTWEDTRVGLDRLEKHNIVHLTVQARKRGTTVLDRVSSEGGALSRLCGWIGKSVMS